MLDRGLGGTPDTAWLWDLMRLIRTQSDTTMSNVSTKDGGGYASANKRTHATHRKHAPTAHTYLYKHTPYHARVIVHLLTYFVLTFCFIHDISPNRGSNSHYISLDQPALPAGTRGSSGLLKGILLHTATTAR